LNTEAKNKTTDQAIKIIIRYCLKIGLKARQDNNTAIAYDFPGGNFQTIRTFDTNNYIELIGYNYIIRV
jgi:hypothetical protein